MYLLLKEFASLRIFCRFVFAWTACLLLLGLMGGGSAREQSCGCWKLLSIYRNTGEVSSSLRSVLDWAVFGMSEHLEHS